MFVCCVFGREPTGIRTHDLLDAIEARSQLRHGPTELLKFTTGLFHPSAIPALSANPCNLCNLCPLYKSYS